VFPWKAREHPMTPDPNNLKRFLDAQSAVYEGVLAELRSGQKRGHWIWFIFPQLRGLGQSETSRFYGIASGEEARAYLQHPVLGARLLECTRLVNLIAGRAIGRILPFPDDLKFRSSMTLFAAVAPEEEVFRGALDKYFDGISDSVTLERLAGAGQ
jgi:uncharacterized protein (DUF1810 family)